MTRGRVPTEGWRANNVRPCNYYYSSIFAEQEQDSKKERPCRNPLVGFHGSVAPHPACGHLQSARQEPPAAVALRHAPAGAAPRGKAFARLYLVRQTVGVVVLAADGVLGHNVGVGGSLGGGGIVVQRLLRHSKGGLVVGVDLIDQRRRVGAGKVAQTVVGRARRAEPHRQACAVGEGQRHPAHRRCQHRAR